MVAPLISERLKLELVAIWLSSLFLVNVICSWIERVVVSISTHVTQNYQKRKKKRKESNT